MTVQTAILILTICSAATIGIVEVIKKLTENDQERKTNLIAIITGFIVGASVTTVYYIANNVQFDLLNTVYIVIMGLVSAIGATLGYDKIIEEIKKLFIKK